MSPAKRVWAMVAALVLLTALALRCDAQARDTTVCTSFRTRTAATGAIVSVSVAKVACGGTARVDTVTVTKRDTLHQFWALTIANGRGIYGIATSLGTKPANFTLPTARVDTVIVARVDTVRVPSPPVHDTVYVAVPPAPVPPPGDTTGVFVYDIPSRVGENNVFKGTTYLGRVMVDNVGQWFAYRYTAGQSLMPVSGPYASQAAAMAGLAAGIP